MAGAYWSIRPPGVEAVPGEVVAEPAPSFAELRARQRLARVVEAKLAEGFEVESREETQVLLVKHPRRWLGVTLAGGTTRLLVSLDQRGYPTVHAA